MFPSDESNESRTNPSQRTTDNFGNISNSTLDKILDVCSQALALQNNKVTDKAQLNAITEVSSTNCQLKNSSVPLLRRSSSTGRLPSSSIFNNNHVLTNNFSRQRKNVGIKIGGAGDASYC